jgi:hypothetical protein
MGKWGKSHDAGDLVGQHPKPVVPGKLPNSGIPYDPQIAFLNCYCRHEHPIQRDDHHIKHDK